MKAKAKTTRKPRKTTIKKARENKKSEEKVIEQLDEFFGMDEQVDIDEILSADQIEAEIAPENLIESVGTVKNLNRHSHTETQQSALKGLKMPLNDEISKFSEYLRIQYRLNIDKILFEKYWRFFLLSENLNLSDLTPRKIEKFLRIYGQYDNFTVDQTLRSLGVID